MSERQQMALLMQMTSSSNQAGLFLHYVFVRHIADAGEWNAFTFKLILSVAFLWLQN